MKRIIILSLALVSALVSCNKAAPDKTSAEEGFKAKGSVPTATISKDIQTDGEIAVVTVSFSGVTGDAMDSLSIGMLYGTDETFYTSSFEPADELKDGSYTLVVKVKDGSTTWFRAVAANINGTSYSETVPVQIPKINYTLVGYYTATVVSEYFGDKYEGSVIGVYVRDNDPTSYIISGVEPYYAGKGLCYPDGNYVKGVYDSATQTITVPLGASLNLEDYSVMGFNSSSYESATDFDNVTFTFDGDGNLYRYNGFGSLESESAEDFEDVYYGDVTYVKVEE